jgi:ubiquinone/menaquinone biosynthesis C-methylase UbiE
MDRVALWLLKLAKLRRVQLQDVSGDYDEFYEKFFEEKDEELSDVDPRMAHRRDTILRTLKEHVPPGANLLDVGCGIGDALLTIPPGYQLHAIDYAHSNVRIASRRLAGRADVRQASIYEMPFPDASMDVALCLEVLEHIEDDRRAVREIHRVLKPGGMLIAAVPYTYYWPQYLKLLGHFRHYTRETFSELLSSNGLTPVAYLPNYPNWHQRYTRRYAMIRAQAMTFGRLMGRKTLYTFRWPWRKEPALRRMERKLEPLRQRDAAMDYSKLPTSTFILARKVAAV